jgi:EmrB/QacA subfamily drug resistance transporter
MSERRPSRLPTVIALLVGTFLSSLDVTVVGTAMPRIVSELKGMALYGWVFSGYLLASTATVPIYGKLADLIGRRITYFIGLGLFLAGSFLCGAATTMPMLVAARVLQGAGGGALFPVTQTIMGDLFPVEERARVQGVFALVWGISSVIGPAVGGAFVTFWTWRWTFFINLPVGAGAWLLLAASYRESPRQKRPPIDVAGALLLATALSLLLAGLGKSGADPLFLVAGILLIAVFLVVERRVTAPVIPPDLFRDRVFAIAFFANFLLGAVLFAFIAYVPLYLQGVVGIPPFTAGMLTAPMSLTWTICSFLSGRMILARGYRPVLRLGGILVACAACVTASAAISTARPALALILFLCGQLLLGAGMGLSSTALVIMVQDRSPWERRGVVTATLQLCRQIGMTLGTAALGALLVAILLKRLASVANAPAPEALLNPMRWAELPPSVLVPSRAALGAALQKITLAVAALAAVCSAAAFVFPDVRATSSSTETAR